MESNTSNSTQEKDAQQKIKTTLLLKPDDLSLQAVASDQNLSIKINNSICSKQKKIKKANLVTSSSINDKIVGGALANLDLSEVKATTSASTGVEASSCCTAKTSKKLNKKFNKLQKKISSLIASNLMETPPLPVISFKSDATAIKSTQQDDKQKNNKAIKSNQKDNVLDDDDNDDDDDLSEVTIV